MTLSTNLPGHLWESTAFALIIAALTLMCKPNRVRLRYRIWFAASVKFLIPFLILVSLGSHLGIHLAVQAEKAPWPTSTGHFFGESGTGPERRVPARESMDFTPVLYAAWASGFSFVLFRWRREWMPVRDALRASMPM